MVKDCLWKQALKWEGEPVLVLSLRTPELDAESRGARRITSAKGRDPKRVSVRLRRAGGSPRGLPPIRALERHAGLPGDTGGGRPSESLCGCRRALYRPAAHRPHRRHLGPGQRSPSSSHRLSPPNPFVAPVPAGGADRTVRSPPAKRGILLLRRCAGPGTPLFFPAALLSDGRFSGCFLPHALAGTRRRGHPGLPPAPSRCGGRTEFTSLLTSPALPP